MSPSRKVQRPNSAKPYARSVSGGNLGTTTTGANTMAQGSVASDGEHDTKNSGGGQPVSISPRATPAATAAAAAVVVEDQPGFPTHAQYKAIEACYLNSLTTKRQNKALISQAMFDRIWDTLQQQQQQPGDGAAESPQFRFWARRMFAIARTDGPKLQGTPLAQGPLREVLLHDNLLVAIQEQLYDLLCYCHGHTNHGGRDKTCALIRRHYAWVPKELVAQFVKACPTCIMKKCGHSDLRSFSQFPVEGESVVATTVSQDGPTVSVSVSVPSSQNKENERALPELRDYLYKLAAQDQENQIDDDGPFVSQADQMEGRGILDEYINHSPASERSPLSAAMTFQDLNGFSMNREVSLYHGLPNGWQYHHDYKSAKSDLRNKAQAYNALSTVGDTNHTSNGPRLDGRPRVPSIILRDYLPDTRVQKPRGREDTLATLSCSPIRGRVEDDDHLPPSLRALQIHPPEYHERGNYLPQIDPSLIGLAHVSPNQQRYYPVHADSRKKKGSPVREYHQLQPVQPSPKRPYLDQFHLSDSFLNSSTDSVDRHSGSGSPAGSNDSISPQFSPFMMAATNSASPASSLLPTPQEEKQQQAGYLNQERLLDASRGIVEASKNLTIAESLVSDTTDLRA